MKVVVTGGSGKLGRWVVRNLISDAGGTAPYEVTVLDRVERSDDDGTRYFPGDVQDLGQVSGALAGADPTTHITVSSDVPSDPRFWSVAEL